MKIKKISCTQFAGVRDCSVSLDGGVNVIFGKNESGKSTLVNLLSRTLFQNAKLRLNLQNDKDFKNLYFPGEVKDGTKGDFADGEITFETENGSYKLSKEWGNEPRCVLSTPGGAIRDQNKIDGILKEQLIYGEGVYSDMLFSSQRNTDSSLQTILDASKKTDAKQEITDAVSQAFAESGGASVDAIEQAIAAKIDEIVGKGKHWDIERKAPERRPNGAHWVQGIGTILKAYYALEDAKKVLDDIKDLESDVDSAEQRYKEREAAVHNAEEAFNKFNKFAGQIAVQNEQKKAIARIEPELKRYTEIRAKWDELTPKLEKAKVLQTEKVSRELVDKYQSAKKIKDETAAVEEQIKDRACPSDADIAQAKSALKNIDYLKNKLCGMNLNAAVTMLNGHNVEITSLLTGKPVTLTGGVAAITEAVKITVPGVMEMQLSPADVNVSDIESQIAGQEIILAEFFEKYKVESVEAAESLAKAISEANRKIDFNQKRLAMLLGDTTFEQLEAKIGTIVTVRLMDDIMTDIIAVCGNNNIDKFIIENNTIIDGYTKDYGSINNLQTKTAELSAELQKTKEALSAEDIPEEYLNISDAKAYLEQLQNNLKSAQALCENARDEKITAENRLESFQENLSDDPAKAVENAKRIFEEQKSLLSHWVHIEEVFKAEKAKIHDNPMQDIAEHFSDYLNLISNGRVSSEFPEANKLDMKIYSGKNVLDYEKLSEGTKETVSLAFRLAVLEHLFPEGGGVIVLDDPFTDMDEERMAQSCELVKKCAERHQVILLTCREEYADMLNGNVVRMPDGEAQNNGK